MRTARRVTVLLLALACAAALAQDATPSAVDRSITLVGRDDATMQVPPPPALPDPPRPAADAAPRDPYVSPPILPTTGAPFPPLPDPRDVLDDAFRQ